MKRINLREHYPFYKNDFHMEVSEKIADLINLLNRKEHADYEYRRFHKAYYSLDVNEGIEKDIVFLVLSPEELYEKKLNRRELFAAINSLPEKQAKRIYAHYFLGMSKAEIARMEAVNKSTVNRSIEQALRSMEKFLKKFL
jgi:RNA polymerase sigma-70 factor (ECF subfamily)